MIQRAIEAEGIRTAAISHLPKVTEKVRAPRSLYLRFPLGRSFGGAGSIDLQRQILQDAVQFAVTGEPESIVELPYRWKR
ncbi:D-proline reductase (dithiol) PrdB [Ammoniphilus resinae]|uniref:D-proline reductase (Dithiol) PrdB n=1 Tax=Ammoniphilus resinae TaxID=861532 RepID=A0ABS4GSQ5_9BACL|nr:D-proline reductase (dithiol) PrdB [Ammoniphilus resinae]